MTNEKINYIEFPTKDIELTKTFFKNVFEWGFEDYGSEYVAFTNAGIAGGFYLSDLHSSTQHGGALVVFYSGNLELTQEKILSHKGKIIQSIFSFPGGRRFHFSDPAGNEFAVWSDKEALA